MSLFTQIKLSTLERSTRELPSTQRIWSIRKRDSKYYSRHPWKRFSIDLTKALVNSNTPFHKFENHSFRNFLENWCGRAAPSESTLREQYLKVEFENSARQAPEALVQHDIYLVIHETTDSQRRSFIANVAGNLCETGCSILYLIDGGQLGYKRLAIFAKTFQKLRISWII